MLRFQIKVKSFKLHNINDSVLYVFIAWNSETDHFFFKTHVPPERLVLKVISAIFEFFSPPFFWQFTQAEKTLSFTKRNFIYGCITMWYLQFNLHNVNRIQIAKLYARFLVVLFVYIFWGVEQFLRFWLKCACLI